MRDGRDHDLQHRLVHLTPINPYSQRQDELRNVVRKRVDKPRTPEIHKTRNASEREEPGDTGVL